MTVSLNYSRLLHQIDTLDYSGRSSVTATIEAHTLQICHTQRTVCYIFGHQNETEFGNGQNVGHP
jgi:hypothetical protein